MPARLIPPTPWTGRDDPEDGAGALRVHHLARGGARGVLGFSSDEGVRRNKGRPGAAEGPAAIRTALANMAAPAGAGPFTDFGDVIVEAGDLEAGQAMLGERVAAGLEPCERLVVLGGGHETAYGSYLGLRARFPEARIGIVNLDAHLDLRAVSAAGPSSGTPFAQIHALDPARFDYLCLGAAEEANTAALFERARDWGVRIVSDHALIADPAAADAEIAALIARSDVLYLTIDIDLMPAEEAPGVSAPAARGVPFRTVERLVARILAECAARATPLSLADLVELSPPRDIDGRTARRAALLARRLVF